MGYNKIPEEQKAVMSSFSCPKQLLETFSDYCYKNKLKRSSVITRLIAKFVEEHKGKVWLYGSCMGWFN